jgi:glycosyltransferase involved in cell wall biosynthesis
VVCATYNGAATVGEQLASIAEQTEPPTELVIVDDASTDDTVAIVRRFAAEAPFPVRVLEQEVNTGPTGTFERGLIAATGDLIAFSDQDDVWYPNRLAAGRALLDRLPEPALVFSPADVVGPALQATGRRTIDDRTLEHFCRSDPFQTLVRQNIATGMTMLFDASLRDLVLPIPSIWLHDSWIAPIAAAVGWVDVVREPLVAYRQHDHNLVGQPEKTMASTLAIVEQEGFEHHRHQAERYRVLTQRLHTIPGVVPAHLELARAQRVHWQRRAELPQGHLARLPQVTRELVTGRYHRRSRGIRSAARDLVAPA